MLNASAFHVKLPAMARNGAGDANARRARRLVAAAETLFAGAGVDAVSLREINAAAGAGNASAIQYHFGDRAGPGPRGPRRSTTGRSSRGATRSSTSTRRTAGAAICARSRPRSCARSRPSSTTGTAARAISRSSPISRTAPRPVLSPASDRGPDRQHVPLAEARRAAARTGRGAPPPPLRRDPVHADRARAPEPESTRATRRSS